MEKYVNDNTIIKDALYNAFKETVSCPLCLSILINPVMCMKCQNVFCKKCINEWSKKDDKCPNRCNEPNYQKCLGKNDILSKLKFKCEACGNIIKYDESKNHLKSCYPDNNFEEENTIENQTQTQSIRATKFAKISKDEIEKLKNEGKEVNYITGKKKIFIFLFYKNSYYFR